MQSSQLPTYSNNHASSRQRDTPHPTVLDVRERREFPLTRLNQYQPTAACCTMVTTPGVRSLSRHQSILSKIGSHSRILSTGLIPLLCFNASATMIPSDQLQKAIWIYDKANVLKNSKTTHIYSIYKSKCIEQNKKR
jgi:hypothetical protein